MICRQCSNIDLIKNTVFEKEKGTEQSVLFYAVVFYKQFIFDLLLLCFTGFYTWEFRCCGCVVNESVSLGRRVGF